MTRWIYSKCGDYESNKPGFKSTPYHFITLVGEIQYIIWTNIPDITRNINWISTTDDSTKAQVARIISMANFQLYGYIIYIHSQKILTDSH